MKKGFTLIELLAVIVILAIIAVIAVPIVLNIISESKNNAALRSAEMYLKAVEYTISDAHLYDGGIQDGEYPITPSGNLCKTVLPCSDENTLKVEINGEAPKSGTITIESGNIKKVDFNIDEKRIIKTEGSKIMNYPEVSTSINIADGSYDIKDGKICLDLACTKTQKLETNGVSPDGGWIAVENKKVVWYDLEIEGNNYPMQPYTEDACFGYVDYYNSTQDLNEYYEMIDYDACLSLVGEGMEQFCNSAHDIITANLSGYNWLTDYVLPRGIIKQIKEFPKDTIYEYFCFDQDLIIPVGVKNITSVVSGGRVNKVVISNTVESYDVYGSYISDVIIPNSVKKFSAGVNRFEKIIFPAGTTEILDLSYGGDAIISSITIKNSKENVIITDDIAWKTGSECESWTGNVKDNPCIHWDN